MRRLLRLTLAVCCTFTNHACISIEFPQGKVLVEALKDMSEAEVETDSVKNQWSARVGAEGRLVTVVRQDEFYIFVADNRNAIAFDGWNVRSIIGFGSIDARVVTAQGEQKKFVNGGNISVTSCSSWHSESGATEGISKVWRQECKGQIRANSIVGDSAGAILEINQVVDADGGRAVLKRL